MPNQLNGQPPGKATLPAPQCNSSKHEHAINYANKTLWKPDLIPNPIWAIEGFQQPYAKKTSSKKMKTQQRTHKNKNHLNCSSISSCQNMKTSSPLIATKLDPLTRTATKPAQRAMWTPTTTTETMTAATQQTNKVPNFLLSNAPTFTH